MCYTITVLLKIIQSGKAFAVPGDMEGSYGT